MQSKANNTAKYDKCFTKSYISSSSKLKRKVLFAHSNGFSARTYATFLQALSPASLRYVPLFGHDSKGRASSSKWSYLSKQLLDCVDRSSSPVVGIGHSMGAVLILQTYYLRPSSFTHLILMDPPLFRPIKQAGIRIAKWIGQSDLLISPARKAKRRRNWWRSKEEANNYLKEKPLFKRFHPKAMKDYITYGLKPSPKKGFTLSFSQQIEYEIFRHTRLSMQFAAVEIPCYLLYSTSYKVCSRSDIRYLASQLPNVRFTPISGGHMFPFEQPKETAHLIHCLLR